MKTIVFAFMFLPLLACGKPPEQPAGAADTVPVAGLKAGEAALVRLAPEEKRNPLPDGGWFIWKFSEKPKLGTVIVKVQVFGKDGEQENSYDVAGEFGMPSMRDHDSGPVKFQTNRKGDYLLPVDIAMEGGWKLLIKFKRDKNEVYAGKVLFDI